MANKRKESEEMFEGNAPVVEEFQLDNSAAEEIRQMQEVRQAVAMPQKVVLKTVHRETEDIPSCLRDEWIEVRFLPQPGKITDPKHVCSGGLAENSRFTVSVPKLRSGVFVDVLTKDEKKYLEACLDLEEGAMSVYNQKNNFWSNSTENGMSKVILKKEGTRLHLSDPLDYIRYKILLANKELICPNLSTLADRRKASYRFVLVSENDMSTSAKNKIASKKEAWMILGRYNENARVLRAIIETITGKAIAKKTPLDFLQTKAGELVDQDAKMFLSVANDPLLNMKILITECVEQSFISKKADLYYLRSDNSPLCEGGEEPTLSVAARYLNNPRRQELRFSLEAKCKMDK